MPEFIADTNGTVGGQTWEDLPEFVQGYLECILFTNTASGISMVDWDKPENVEAVAEGTADGSIPGDAGFGDFHPASIEQALSECADFVKAAGPLLAQAVTMFEQTRAGPVPYDMMRAGNDFWYDRCGHGVGFTDRGLGDVGEQLYMLAKTYGDIDVSFGAAASGAESPTGYGFVFAY